MQSTVRYSLLDIVTFVVAIVLLIPLVLKIGEIVYEFVTLPY